MPRIPNAKVPAETPKPKKRSTNRSDFVFLRFNILVMLITLGLYYSVTIKPESFWVVGLLGFLIPPALLINLVFLLFWISRKPLFAIFPGFTLLLGIRFISAMIGWHFLQLEPCKDFKIFSLNARTFGGLVPKEKSRPDEGRKLIDQVVNSDADIICIQEMFDNPKSKDFNVIKRLKNKGFKHVYFSKAHTFKWGASVGMGIFSKYPILSRSVIRKKAGSNNQIIRTKIDVGGQSLVLINMHLQSAFIKEEEVEPKFIKSNFYTFLRNLVWKLSVANKQRTKQIDLLLASTLDEDLPVIICGDMNETPYSNAYLRIRDSFQNGFEEKGSGLGITYAGLIPFLRIDHQFANSRIKFTRFKTRKDLVWSDHFGTEACYSFVTKP
ncbi:MAG TPA: endonuclease/exonuclease/phosphatase family protein [Catalimonadaceae bacterium]|nr:endonuclease/exonuclease/phosphatase family protein [Catalimonadaceae bacterium]